MVNNAHHNYYFQLSVTTVASRLEKKISDQDGINDIKNLSCSDKEKSFNNFYDAGKTK